MEKGVDEALAGIPGWANVDYRSSQLSGGLTNRSFLIERGADRFVLRLNAPHTEFFALDRETELKILRTAAQRDLAPEVLYSDIEEGILLSVFVPGEVWTPAHLKSSDNLERVAKLLGKVHTLPLSGSPFSAVAAAQKYIDAIGLQGPWLEIGERCQKVIRNNQSDVVGVCCHNDPVTGNIVESTSLLLLDWEYACDNDPYFDLAVIIAHHQLGQRDADILLSAYAGGLTAERQQLLRRQRRVYDALLWLWLAARNMATNDSQTIAEMAAVEARLVNYDY